LSQVCLCTHGASRNFNPKQLTPSSGNAAIIRKVQLMNTLRALLPGLMLWSLSLDSHAAETAQMRLSCYSVRFHQAETTFGDTLDLTSIPPQLNGELFPSGPVTYSSNFQMDWSGFPITGGLDLGLPAFADANVNGFDDFFEVAQGVPSTMTSGVYDTAVSTGTLTANWSRGPGSKNGTCILTLNDSIYGSLGRYVHTFEVLEYTGPLTYTPGHSNVMANLNLTQTGDPANTLHGPALFSKVLPGDLDYLVLRDGGWTNAAAQALPFVESDLSRDTFLGTNYYGYVEFADGDPNTSGYDYPFWELSIDDLNDRDHDGIPDFSDDPAASVPGHPTLTLQYSATNLLLTISGDVGRLHLVLENTSLAAGNWQTNLSLVLTNDPQTVLLPLPTTPNRFWRAMVP
jgi:hypothetical protein